MDVNFKPTISVLMAVYNGEEYLAQSITSIINQTFESWELIVVNDFSTDKTAQILAHFAKKENRIVIVENEQNLGLAASLNIGIEKAQGKYIARLDADDISMPQRFSVQVDFLEKRPDVFLVGAKAKPISYDEQHATLHKISYPKNIRKALLDNVNPFVHSSIMFRNETKYRDKFRFGQDLDLYLCLLSKNKTMLNIDQELILFRYHDKSVSSQKRAMQIAFAMEALKHFHQREIDGKDSYDDFDVSKLALPQIAAVDFIAGRVKDLILRKQNRNARNLLSEWLKTNKSSVYILLLYVLTLMPTVVIKGLVWYNDKNILLKYR